MAVYIGNRVRGFPGAVAGFLGVTVPPFFIALAVGWWFYSPYNVPAMHAALRGCAAGAIGLTLANAIELTGPEMRAPLALAIVALTAVAVAVFHLHLVLTLLLFGGLGIARYLIAQRKAKPA